MKMKKEIDVLVVGAGPVGMFTALSLTRRGLSVRIVDRGSHLNRASYALVLHPSSLLMLNDFGLLGELEEDGRRIEETVFQDGESVMATVEFSVLHERRAYALVVPQSRLEKALMDALHRQGVTVEWDQEVTELQPEADAVTARIARLETVAQGYAVSGQLRVEGGVEMMRARYVIGADGLHSTVRRLIASSVVSMGRMHHYDVFEFKYAGALDDAQRVVMTPHGMCTLWPMANGHARWTFEVPPQHAVLPSPRELHELIRERVPWFSETGIEVVWTARASFSRYYVSPFSRGRVWLAGDAAHQTSPIGGQSMNMGLVEGDFVSLLLSERETSADPGRAVHEYDESRRDQWRWLLDPDTRSTAITCNDPWIRKHTDDILSSLPASGHDLRDLMLHVRPTAVPGVVGTV